MKLEKIKLTNFRNFKSKLLKFSPETTVIVGPNASGKTNVLEALYLLSTGKSFRARVEEEMIRHRQEISRIKGRIYADIEKTDLDVVLTRGEIKIGEDPDKEERSLPAGKTQHEPYSNRIEKAIAKSRRAPRKKLLVNGVSRRLFNFAGNFKVVMFGPWDLDLVTESPSVRRKFLDFVLSQVDKEYYRASLSYEKGLRQRNRLLFRIREEALPTGRQGLSRPQLVFWNRLLIKNGDYISAKRGKFIDYVNSTKDFPASTINKKQGVEDYSIEYDRSAISEARLEQYANEEVASATTLVGPHRDDFCLRLKKNRRARDLARYGSRGEPRKSRSLARFGSRGEQRMGVLWLKLAELAYIESETEEEPTLLLDDIFSELDHEHRKVVMEFIKGQQTIITTADPHFVKSLKKVEKIVL